MQQNLILVIVLTWFSSQIASKSVVDDAGDGADELVKLGLKTYELQSKIAGVNTEVCALEAKMKEKGEILQNQLDTVRADVTNIMTLVEDHTADQATLRQDINDLVQRLDSPVSTPVPTGEYVCPDNWVKYDRHCLYFGTDSDWNTAKTRCQYHGAHLLVVDTEKMNTFLKILLRRSGGNPHYVGGLDFGRQNWIWDHTNTELSYTDWRPNQPSGGRDEHCLLICFGPSCQWNDYSCDSTSSYICQRDPVLE